MPSFDITVSDLLLSPGVDQTFARWSVDDPNAVSGLGHLQLDIVELWSATSNDRSHASFAKVGEGINETIHYIPGLSPRYYWARARNRSGIYGDWYPLSPTAGATLSASEWVEYVPAYSTSIGTITSTLVTPAASYWKMGRIVHVEFKFGVLANGTGAGSLILSLPIAKGSLTTNPAFIGYETASNRAVVGSMQSTTTVAFRLYDGTYPLSDGVLLYASGTYESDA